jgi:hypothetical protein
LDVRILRRVYGAIPALRADNYLIVLTLPALNADTGFWISVVVGASFILAAPIAWWMAP